jgi:hypothetical protein
MQRVRWVSRRRNPPFYFHEVADYAMPIRPASWKAGRRNAMLHSAALA